MNRPPKVHPVYCLEFEWSCLQVSVHIALELYELSNDPTESQDLAKEQPEVAKRLHKKLTRWRKRIGAQIPYPNPNYDPEATWRRPQG